MLVGRFTNQPVNQSSNIQEFGQYYTNSKHFSMETDQLMRVGNDLANGGAVTSQ